MWTQGAEVLLERTFPDTLFDELKAIGKYHITQSAHSTTGVYPIVHIAKRRCGLMILLTMSRMIVCSLATAL